MLLQPFRSIIPSIRLIIPPTRLLSTTRVLLGFEDFFQKGAALPVHSSHDSPSIGRAWYASELRLKSFLDLHKLWFVLLKERNLLSTQELEARRLGQQWTGWERVHKVKLGMARIKTVLTERAHLHKQAKDLVVERQVSEGDLLVAMQRKDKLGNLERKRHYRKRINYRNRRLALFT